MSGYVHCACRDCFDIAIASDGEPALCHECEEAGCSPDDPGECQRDDAYGAESLCSHGNWLCSEPGCENNPHREG